MATNLSAADLFSAKGLVVVITGGGSGLGLYMAKALDANGAEAVYIVGRRKERLEAAAKEGLNGRIIPLQGDVTSKESLKNCASIVREKHGYVNALVCNSGISGVKSRDLLPKDRKATVKEFADALWGPEMEAFTEAYHVNTTAVFYTVLAFLELLDEGNKKGNVEQKSQILITSSIASYMRVPASGFAYCASKAGVNSLMKTLSTYFAEYKIRVNTIAPGLYPSEMTTNAMKQAGDKNPWEDGAMPHTCPLERTGSEADMAGAALFLLTRAGAYISGNMLVTDGGRVSQFPSSY